MKVVLIAFLLVSTTLSCADVQNQSARVAENASSVVREIGKDAWKVPPKQGTTCQQAATKCSNCNGGCGQ